MFNSTIVEGADNHQGKISSFWHLTSENAIVIPVIQRDYAQGRSSEEVRQVREPFLKKIFKVLASGNEKLELDFIYGSLEKPKDISLGKVDHENFMPLDGQQRLTTLFLLHWFLAIWNNQDFEQLKEHVSNRFSYTTRQSSSEFCVEILQHINPQEIVQSILDENEDPISSVIKDEGWFHIQWGYDPTISGMLIMLDTMSYTYSNTIDKVNWENSAHTFFQRLTTESINDSAITFNLLYLNKGDFHLSDELYIKMNSRGKPLSDFETFKARFESFMEKNTNVSSDFAANIDGKWSDIFWDIRNDVKPKSIGENCEYYRDNTDGMMMNVIKVTLANKYAILAEDKDNGLDELFESQVAKKSNPERHLTFYRYTELGVFNEQGDNLNEEQENQIIDKSSNKEICQCVYDSFDIIYELKKSLGRKIDNNYLDVDDCFKCILFYGVDGKDSQYLSASYQNRLLYWALSEYCISYKDSIQKYPDYPEIYNTPLNRWIRFVRNMAESVEINTVNDMQKALKFLNFVFTELSKETSGDIVTYLSKQNTAPDCSPFPMSQLKEEIFKAQLIVNDDQWEKSISSADNTKQWPGRSGYLLFFANLSDKASQDMIHIDHQKYRIIFDSYKQKMDMLLQYLETGNYRDECLLERAMLSKGNYFRKEPNDNIIYSMMDQSVTSRSYSFRQMVQFNGIGASTDDSVYKEGVLYLKSVLDDADFKCSNKVDVKSSLKKIIKKTSINDWRWPLIYNQKIWAEASQRFLWINKDTAWVVRQKGGATNQYEVWSYHLFLCLKDNNIDYDYYPHSYPKHTYFNFLVDEQIYQLRIEHNVTGEWVFDMIALDKDFNEIVLTQEMLRTIFSIMPNNSCKFSKKAEKDAIVWATAMFKYIKRNYKLTK